MEPRIIQLMPMQIDQNSRIRSMLRVAIIALALVEQDGVQKLLYVGGDLPEARLLTAADFES